MDDEPCALSSVKLRNPNPERGWVGRWGLGVCVGGGVLRLLGDSTADTAIVDVNGMRGDTAITAASKQVVV